MCYLFGVIIVIYDRNINLYIIGVINDKRKEKTTNMLKSIDFKSYLFPTVNKQLINTYVDIRSFKRCKNMFIL